MHPDWHGFLGPRALDRYRPLWLVLEALLMTIAVLFWVSLGLEVSAFSPETWGNYACEWPAKLWGGLLFLATGATITGLMRPVTARRVAVGAAIQAAVFLILAVSASFTGGQFVIGAYLSILFVPMHLLLAAQAVRYDPR